MEIEMEAKKEVKEYLFTDLASYETAKRKEDKVFLIFEQLKTLSKTALGDTKIDFKAYLADCSNFLINTYWTEFKPGPDHLSNRKESIFSSQTGIDVNHIKKLNSELVKAIMDMQHHMPTITTTGLKSNLKVEKFKKYLNPAVADKYHILVDLVKNAEAYQKYENAHMVNLVKFSNHLRLDGLSLVINYYDFAL